MAKNNKKRQVHIGSGIYNEGQNHGVQAGRNIIFDSTNKENQIFESINAKNIPDSSHLLKLHEILVNYFDIEELKTLCFNLYVDFDNLRGQSKEHKARELVLLMKRKSRIPELTNEIIRIRPNIS